MNPLTNMKNVTKLSESELKRGGSSSWHDQYKNSAWIFVGGLPYDLTEGDVISVFSQCGEIVNLNLVRDKVTGKQKGFCFICYEDQRSTILAVDNLNGIKILGKSLRVDHVSDYKPPKDHENYDDETRQLHTEGCAPKIQLPPEQIKREQSSTSEVVGGVRLPMRLPIDDVKQEKPFPKKEKKEKKSKKHKKEKKFEKDKKTKKSKKSKRSRHSSTSDQSSSSASESDYDSDRRRKKSRH